MTQPFLACIASPISKSRQEKGKGNSEMIKCRGESKTQNGMEQSRHPEINTQNRQKIAREY